MRLFGTLAGAAVLAAGFFAFRPDLAVVEEVRFTGNERASDVALRHLVDIRNGTTIWTVDLERARHGAEAHPWVRSAEVRRRWPAGVEVVVEEYEPVALLAHDGLYYIDRSGAVFLRARGDDIDYPVITGADTSLERTHPDLPRLVVRDAVWLLDDLDRRGLVARDDVSEVAFARARGFTVHLVTGAELRFGLQGLGRQTDRLARLVGEGVNLGAPVLVDLAPATVAIVRPRSVKGIEG